MFETTTLLTYITASIIIILAPGPAQALVIARTIGEGRKAGIITAIGLNTAVFVHAIGAAIGLSAILSTSTMAFNAVKYIGAVYLIYLGINAFKTHQDLNIVSELSNKEPTGHFTKAFITGVLNPKVALFFLAFVPQFVDPRRGWVIMQFILLGGILAVLDIVYESLLAVLVAKTSDWFAGNSSIHKWRQRVTGAVLMGLGVRLFFMQQI
ncbi:MAG: LysE family translocator [Ignavibacteriales bacterium]|nr:LysE family translocator [Ignavibacteriales bacterium]